MGRYEVSAVVLLNLLLRSFRTTSGNTLGAVRQVRVYEPFRHLFEGDGLVECPRPGKVDADGNQDKDQACRGQR